MGKGKHGLGRRDGDGILESRQLLLSPPSTHSVGFSTARGSCSWRWLSHKRGLSVYSLVRKTDVPIRADGPYFSGRKVGV